MFILTQFVHSSVVEHLTADQEVTGSNTVGPFICDPKLPTLSFIAELNIAGPKPR